MNELFGLQAPSKPLEGKFARVPMLIGRAWTEIVDQSVDGKMIKVRYAKHRHPRWVKVSEAIEIRDRTGKAARS